MTVSAPFFPMLYAVRDGDIDFYFGPLYSGVRLTSWGPARGRRRLLISSSYPPMSPGRGGARELVPFFSLSFFCLFLSAPARGCRGNDLPSS